jgi:hypothetical protein
MVSADHFAHELRVQLNRATKHGSIDIVINSGELYRSLGDYPGSMHGMPACYDDAMRSEMKPGDVLLSNRPAATASPFAIGCRAQSETRNNPRICDFMNRADSPSARTPRQPQCSPALGSFLLGVPPLKKPQALAHCGSPGSKIECYKTYPARCGERALGSPIASATKC